MRKIKIHWDRLSFGTLIDLAAAQQTTEYEQLLLFCRALDPLINGTSLIDRPIAETHAIIAQFAAEGATKIPQALAAFGWAMGVPQLPPAPVVKDTAAYTAQSGGDTTQN